MTSQKERPSKPADEPGNAVQASANGRQGRLPRRPLTAAHKDRLESIKSVAAELFYWHGYSATDLRRIADEAGMHVASLYNYVSGKEELLFQIMRDGVVEINASLDEALEGCSDPLERLKRSLISHISHHAHRRHSGAVSHTEVRSLTASRRTRMIKMRRDYEARWDELVIDGMKTGIISPGEPRVIVYALLSVGQSVSRWYDPSGKIPVSELAENLADMLLFGLINGPTITGDRSEEGAELAASEVV